jgi:hypothetical protein
MEDLLRLHFASQVNQAAPIITDPYYSKAQPNKIDYERMSPYFVFRPHDDIQNILRKVHN